MKDWLSRRRTMTEILAEIDLHTDAEQVARIRADMHAMALGSRYIDMSKLVADVQRSKENRLMPEYIERFFLEAYRSFGGTITPVKGRKGGWSISRIPPDLRKLPESLERKYGKIGHSTRNSPSTKSRSSATPTSNSSGQVIHCLRASSSAYCGSTGHRSGRGRASITPTPWRQPSCGCSSAGLRTGEAHGGGTAGCNP